MWAVRPELEAQFPSLVFHFFYSSENDKMTVRAMTRLYNEDANLYYSRRGKPGAQMYEEDVDMDTFPTKDFLARIALIA